MKIVIVEDEIRIREGIRNLLHKMFPKHEVVGEAENGEEGLELVLKLRPDLVSTDIKMPIMDGLDSARLIVKSDPAAKIIMLSAMGDEDLMKSAKEIGIRVFLQKPFKSDEMLKAIAQVMGASGA